MSFGFGFDDWNVHSTPVHPRLFPNLPLTALGGLERGIRTSGRVTQMERLRPSAFATSRTATTYGTRTAQRGDVRPLTLSVGEGRGTVLARHSLHLPQSSPKASVVLRETLANNPVNKGRNAARGRRGRRRVSTSTCLFHRRLAGQNSSWGEVVCRRSDMPRTRLA